MFGNSISPRLSNAVPIYVPAKMPSKNKQQIHRRTPTSKFVSHKTAMKLHWKHTLCGRYSTTYCVVL